MINGKSNSSSFMHPGYIQEDPGRLIDFENINLNTDPKFKNINTDLIQTEEKAYKNTHNQEISGAFQEKSPEAKYEGKERNREERNREEKLFILEKLEKEIHDKNISLHEEMNKTASLIKQDTLIRKWIPSCLKQCFIHKKKFEKIRIYYGPNSTQDDIYRHPNNSVRTTKFFLFFSSYFYFLNEI